MSSNHLWRSKRATSHCLKAETKKTSTRSTSLPIVLLDPEELTGRPFLLHGAHDHDLMEGTHPISAPTTRGYARIPEPAEGSDDLLSRSLRLVGSEEQASHGDDDEMPGPKKDHASTTVLPSTPQRSSIEATSDSCPRTTKSLQPVPKHAPRDTFTHGQLMFIKGVRIRDYSLPRKTRDAGEPSSPSYQCRDGFNEFERRSKHPKPMEKQGI